MQLFKKIYDVQFKLIALAIVLLSVIMGLVVFGQVVMRYVLDQPFGWTEELARITFLLWTLLGAILAYREDRHMGLNIIEVRITDNRRREVFVLVKNILVLIFCAVMFWQGIQLVTTLNAKTPILRLSFSYIYAIVPFMMASIGVMCTIRIIMGIKILKSINITH